MADGKRHPGGQSEDRQPEQDDNLPPIAEGVEEAVGSPPRETVSGDPNYAPDAEYVAHPGDESERRTP